MNDSSPLPQDGPGRWLPRAEAAQVLGVSLRTLDRYLADHRYAHRKRQDRSTDVWLPAEDGAPLARQEPDGDAPAPDWETTSAILARHFAPSLDRLAATFDAATTTNAALLAFLETWRAGDATVARQAEEIARLRAQLAAAEAQLAQPWWRRLWGRLAGRSPRPDGLLFM